jgi:hypothetical protein
MHAEEESVTVCAVRAFILRRDKRGNHLFVPASERSIGEDQLLRQVHHVPQQRRMRREALQYPWNIGPAEVGAKVSIERGHFIRGRALFNQGYVSWRIGASVPAQARNLFVFR